MRAGFGGRLFGYAAWTGEGEAEAPVGTVGTPVLEVMIPLSSPQFTATCSRDYIRPIESGEELGSCIMRGRSSGSNGSARTHMLWKFRCLCMSVDEKEAKSKAWVSDRMGGGGGAGQS